MTDGSEGGEIGEVTVHRAGCDGPSQSVWSGGSGRTVQFAFGAAFTSVRTIPLRPEPGERLTIADLLQTPSGRFWIADAQASALKIYSQQGRPVRALGRRVTGLERPTSLVPLHGRWVAVLDGHLPRLAILDEAGRPVRRFPLPEVDRPLQICNLGNRMLAVVGSGWGRGAGSLVHLYSLAGEYVESLFGEPRDGPECGRPYVATAGSAVYLAHSRTDSFAIYDVEARAVLAFPSQAVDAATVRETAHEGTLHGLFATACGPLLAMYAGGAGEPDYVYDLYALSGKPIALGLRTPERVVGLEGQLFYYTVRATPGGGTTLRVWKLKFEGNVPAGTLSSPTDSDRRPGR